MSQSLRMHQVQAPVIPIVGDLVRGHPGTISLGKASSTMDHRLKPFPP